MGPKRVADDEIIVRRFDPDDDRYWTHDDAGHAGRLRSSALRFHPDNPAQPDERNCSVYQEQKLAANGLSKWDAIEETRPGWGVATIKTEVVRKFSRDNLPAPSPFHVYEDEYPDGPEGAHLRDSAHAVISYRSTTAGADKWCRDLAMRFSAERQSA